MYTMKEANIQGVGSGTAFTLTSTGVAAYSYLCLSNLRITRIMAYTTAAIVGPTTAPVISFYKYSAYNNSSGQVLLGTITIPNGTTADKCLYKDITPANLVLGDQIIFNTTVAATGTSAAGAALFKFEYDLDPESAGNQSKMVASA